MTRLRAAVRWFAQGGPPRWLVAIAFLFVLGMYCTNDDMGGDPAAPRGTGEYRPVLARGDGHMMYLMARSTALDLDWNFDNDLAGFGDPWNQPRGPNGHKVIPHPIGPPLLWTPLVWTAAGLAELQNLMSADIPSHGYTEWHQRFVFLSSVLAAWAAIAIAMLVARILAGGRWAPAYAGVCGLLGTALTYYATYMPSYGHALDTLACAGFLGYWAITIGRTDVWRWIALGALLGVAMLIRMQDLGLGIVVAFEAAVSAVRALRARTPQLALRAVLGGTVVLGVALIVFFPQLVYWKVIYGGFFAAPQGGAYTRLGSPMILELLYSARNGWFSTHPLAYAGVLGLFALPRKSWHAAAGLLLAVAVQIYLNSSIFDYWGMASFGNRRLCSMTLPVVVGLAALLWRGGRLVARWPRIPRVTWHVVAIAMLAPFVGWNLWRVTDFKAGRPAPDGLEPSCCDKLPKRFARPLRKVYAVVGNPFQFPANLVFALRHDVEIQRWDHAVGNYPVLPPSNLLFENKLAGQKGRWRLGYPLAEPYLIGKWSGPHDADRPFRWTREREVRALVPNLMPNDQHVTIWLAPGGTRKVTVKWDGHVVFAGELAPRWNAIGFTLHDHTVGEHELSIESELGPLLPMLPPAEGKPWPEPKWPVGVALGTVDLEILR